MPSRLFVGLLQLLIVYEYVLICNHLSGSCYIKKLVEKVFYILILETVSSLLLYCSRRRQSNVEPNKVRSLCSSSTDTSCISFLYTEGFAYSTRLNLLMLMLWVLGSYQILCLLLTICTQTDWTLCWKSDPKNMVHHLVNQTIGYNCYRMVTPLFSLTCFLFSIYSHLGNARDLCNMT